MSVELKPCPFCGGAAKITNLDAFGNAAGFRVECENRWNGCMNMRTHHGTKKDAISAWNKRATDSGITSLQETNRRLVGVLKNMKDAGVYLCAAGANGNVRAEGEQKLIDALEETRALLSELEQDKSDE